MGGRGTGECLEADGYEASTRKSEPGVDVVCGWRGQEVETRWGSGSRERVARWKSELAALVAGGEARESGRVLQGGPPYI